MRDEGGASAAEFAIVVVPMTIIFLVIIQFGFILYVQNSMQNATREAARRMVVDETTTFVEGGSVDCPKPPASPLSSGTVAAVACGALLPWAGVFAVTTDTAPIGTTEYSEMTVSISVDMGTVGIFDFFGVAYGNDMGAAATFRSEYTYP